MKPQHLQNHVGRVLSIAGGAEPLLIVGDNENAIQRSWYRCVNQHGLDPAAKHQPFVETSVRLNALRNELGGFLKIARAGIEQLAKNVGDIGYVLVTDAEGVILDYIGNDSWDRSLPAAGLLPGASWKEQYTGTNGIGTCIVERSAIACHRDDHFHTTQIGLSCNSQPLFGPEGKFLGVLNVSALPTPHTRGHNSWAAYLARQCVQLIESASFKSHFRRQWIVRLGTSAELLEVSGDKLLAVDSEGLVVGANTSARNLLTTSCLTDAPVGKHLTEIFKCGFGDVWNLMRPQNAGDAVTLKAKDHADLFASALPPRETRPCDRGEKAGQSRSLDAACPALTKLAGEDSQMVRVIGQARRLVNKRVNILIQGETGTGKEVMARALHESSDRADKPFIAVNCAAIPESLIESELFGYTAGTFTGARSKGMQGLIVRSDGGTLFLDEIGDMPLQLQTRLLRVLSEKEVLPLGADRSVPVDITVLSASHRDLRKLVAEEGFRQDLYYRLCGATLCLPPLRERQDRSYIIYRILSQEASQLGCKPWIDQDAMDLLLRYAWPGNARELRNALRFALAISDDGIFVQHLPPEITTEVLTPHESPRFAHIEGDEFNLEAMKHNELPEPSARLKGSLRRNKWNITAVAAELGLCRTSVYRQMKRFGIVPPTHM